MDGNKQQKTIPTVYNMSSSKAREVLWALEELADAGIKYNVVNLRRGRADTYKVLKFTVPARKVPNRHAGTRQWRIGSHLPDPAERPDRSATHPSGPLQRYGRLWTFLMEGLDRKLGLLQRTNTEKNVVGLVRLQKRGLVADVIIAASDNNNLLLTFYDAIAVIYS